MLTDFCIPCEVFCESKGICCSTLATAASKRNPSVEDTTMLDQIAELKKARANIRHRDFVPEPLYKEIVTGVHSAENPHQFQERSDYKGEKGDFPDEHGLQQARKRVLPDGKCNAVGLMTSMRSTSLRRSSSGEHVSLDVANITRPKADRQRPELNASARCTDERIVWQKPLLPCGKHLYKEQARHMFEV